MSGSVRTYLEMEDSFGHGTARPVARAEAWSKSIVAVRRVGSPKRGQEERVTRLRSLGATAFVAMRDCRACEEGQSGRHVGVANSR